MRLLVTLQPLEPFFFGGDQTYAYGDTKIQRAGRLYFIRSFETPSQTTLFGAARFLGIRDPQESYALTEADKRLIGPGSYRLRDADQSFGLIQSISPLYLLDEAGHFFMKTPLDHRIHEQAYEPWRTYDSSPMKTDAGERIFPKSDDYKGKDGLADSWTRLDDLSIHENLVEATTRVGVSTELKTDGLYKKEWRFMRNHRFAFIVQAEEGFVIAPRTMYLGQKKSAFRAQVHPIGDGAPDFQPLRDKMKQDMAIALSDVYVKSGARSLYQHCAFVCAGVREHRAFTTQYVETPHRGRFQKGEELIRLIRAGSVFCVRDDKARAAFLKCVADPHAGVAGFNHFIYGKEWNVV